MSLDVQLLQALKAKKRFDSLYSFIPTESFEQHTQVMLRWYATYFRTYPDHETLDVDSLFSMIKLKGKLTKEQLVLYSRIVAKLREDLSPDMINNTIDILEDLRCTAQVKSLINQFDSGGDIDIVHELAVLSEATKQRKKTMSQSSWADGDVMDYITALSDDYGYQFDWLTTWHCEGLRGAVAGDNIGLAMATDKGKTSLLCRAAVCLAKQHKERLEDGREEVFRPVLMLINEGTAEKITPRIYQTALVTDLEGLAKLGRDGINSSYVRTMGRRDAIRLVNIHGMTTAQVYRTIEAHNPFCVITDMTGRIKAPQAQGANDTQQLEMVWDTMRQFAAMNKFFHIGTVQISAEGFGLAYPPLSALQGSKTGIQTTLDLGIYVGYNDEEPDKSLWRYIGTPKNKLAKSGYKSNIQASIIFEPHRNVWSDYNGLDNKS